MIGSVLFYVLYPFSRFLTGRNTEAPRKGHPSAVVIDKAVWDGGTVTTLLDQCLSSSSGMEAETKERMKKQIPEMTYLTYSNKDKELFAIQEDVKNGDAPNNSDVNSVEGDEEGEGGHLQLQKKVESLENGCRKITHQDEKCHVKKHTEKESVIMKGGTTLKQELCTQLDCLNMEENLFPGQEKFEQPSLDAPVVLAEPTIQEISCQIQKQTKTSIMKKSKTQAGETECWDEYCLPAENEVLTNAQTHLEIKQHDAQTGWHFPAGPGLAEEVWCPLWQFPAVSYYPPLEPTGLFEVMWRVWEEVDESTTAAEPAPKFSPFTSATMDFTVMSYNILAQDLLEANQELYTHCPLEVLDWSYRCSLLLKEIGKWAPDILCLQEVQENHYNERLFPVLSQMGYTCVYKRRTGDKTDGCATCYRSNLFSERSLTLLEFYRPDTELLDRHNVGIVLLLQPAVTRDSVVKAKGPPLCVANTHLLFNPRRGDVKLAQLAILMAEIDSVVKSCKAMGEHCNIILCGDFNSLPHTPLYQLITTGELYFQGLPAWRISGQEDLSYKVHCHRLLAPLWPSSLGITDSCQYSTAKEVFKDQNQKPGKRQFSHDFLLQLRFCPAACIRPVDLELIPGVTDNTPDPSVRDLPEKSFRHTISLQVVLDSVYKHSLPGSGNPEVTTLHSEGGATVDYIFYTPRRVLTADHRAGDDYVNEGLKLIGSLSLLSEDVLWSMRGLPNHIFPSDHLSLLAKFQLELNAA